MVIRSAPHPAVQEDVARQPSANAAEFSQRVPEPDEAGPYSSSAALRWLYQRFFHHIRVDERWSGVVADAAERGVVVYTMRSVSVVDFLCLDFLVKRFDLPRIRYVNELGLGILEPFGHAGRRIRLRRNVAEDQALSDVVRSRHSALLFLRRPPRFGHRAHRKGEQLDIDLIQTLVETQRELDTPIFVVPQTFVWTKRPPKPKPGLMDLFFGPVEWPGQLRVSLQFLLNYRNGLLRSGEPFDVKAFLDEHPALDDGQVADKLRYALLRRMERERTVVLGPTQKTPTRIQEELLRSPRVRKHIEGDARSRKKPVPSVEEYARKELKRLCAKQDPGVISVLRYFLDWLWHQLYDGLVVDEEGVERVREAARKGAIVLLPSHKSHVDYLVLSYVLYTRDLSPPIIAAGDNLNFAPVGPLLRRGGGFFIKRSFRGNKLYATLVDAYIRKLLVSGFPLEFFLEGGRSRTGKLLPPKFGLMSMVTDAALLLPHRKVQFVPVSIDYERVIEEGAYVHELSGGEKQKESLGELLKTPRVLRSKYGRLYVQFGEILDFDEVLQQEVGKGRQDAIKPPEKRALVQRLAHRAVYEIDRVTLVTPAALVATALLVHRRRGALHGEVADKCDKLLRSLDRLGAPVARHVRGSDGGVRADVVREAIALFTDAKLISRHNTDQEPVYSITDQGRMALEYYKNNILHFFVASALISSALMADEGEPMDDATLRERVQELSRLFKYEFMYRADAPFDEIFEDALDMMKSAGEVERVEGRIRVAGGSGGTMVQLYAEMLRTYFESYLVTTRSASAVIDEPVSQKDLIKHTLALGDRMQLVGALDLRESVSKSKLENALLALRDRGLIRFGKDELIEPGPEANGRDDFKELEQRLASYAR